ncbi:MAG: D-glycero-beta-D-manno-heptose 1,7-bisphosphate 7-phosphatase [Anaerolineales bacterium]|nr:D-glycero-beta-D-manno-heptose 1,7-bisphosphate 7-phosphatase [Anaerolineales bacterium]
MSQPVWQALFLDRDGTLNEERADYVKNWSEFVWLPGALHALAELAGYGAPIILITNQSVIGRGIITEAEVQTLHTQMLDVIGEAGGRIDGIFICPHPPDAGCDCRKPQPGLLLQAAAAFGLDLRRCLFIGDTMTDFQAAQAAGCPCVLVRTGRQGAQLDAALGVDGRRIIFDDLAAATRYIMGARE